MEWFQFDMTSIMKELNHGKCESVKTFIALSMHSKDRIRLFETNEFMKIYLTSKRSLLLDKQSCYKV